MGRMGTGPSRKARRGGRGKRAAPPSRDDMEALLAPYRAGRAAEAAAAARRFTKRWPQEPAGWGVLSESAAALGQLDEAIEAGRRLTRIDSGNAQAHAGLAALLQEAGQGEAALAACRKAVEIRPSDAGMRYNLAGVLRDLGRFEEAVDTYHEALERRPDWAEAYNNLGNALCRLGRTVEGLEALEHAAELSPRAALVHNNLGNQLLDAGRYEEAEASLRRALELQPRYPEALTNLGRLLWAVGRLHEAETVHRQALELQPDLAEARNNLANILYDLGKIAEAEAAYRECLVHRPDDVQVHYRLAQSRRFTDNDTDLARIEALLERSTDLSAEDRVKLHYAAGKGHADIGTDPARAFGHFAEGARHERARIDYEVAADESFFDDLARHFTAERIRHPAGDADPTPTPVFIVGMPRSGTTLVEQILATHTAVAARGELPDLEHHLNAAARAAGSELGGWLAEASPEAFAAVGRAYRESVIDPAEGAARVTDKMPLNFRFAGVIALALPGARIIHVRRDPADTCLACFRQLFGGELPFTYDLEELGRYYRAYAGLMDHWRSVLPEDRLMNVRYEELVEEPEREIRRLLDFCDLEWDPACLDFHRTERAVHTASAEQVRRPLYTTSVGRWRAYREHLGPLLEALGPLAPEDRPAR